MRNPAIRHPGFFVGVRITRLSIRTIGFARTVSILGSFPRFQAGQTTGPGDTQAWAAAIDSVSGRPYGGTCLDRSVLLWFVMRSHGTDGTIRIGLTTESGLLEGHAWVEMDGRVLNDAQDVADRFAVFDEDPVGIVFL